MNFRLLPIALIALLILSFEISLSQDESDESDPRNPGQKRGLILIGPCAGFNTSLHSVQLPSFDQDIYCPFFKTGSGNGFYAGLTYEYVIGKPALSVSSIIVRATYNTLPYHMVAEGDNYQTLVPVDSVTKKAISSRTQHTVDITYNLLSFDFLYKQNIDPTFPLGGVAGLTFDIPMTKNKTQKYSIIEPANAQFDQSNDQYLKPGEYYTADRRTLIKQDGPIANAASLRIGIKIGIQYEIPLQVSSKMSATLVPHIFYNYGLTKVTSTDNWNVNALQIGVDIRFGL